jgi:hypothetical protein
MWRSIVASLLGEVPERGREPVQTHRFGGYRKEDEIS